MRFVLLQWHMRGRFSDPPEQPDLGVSPQPYACFIWIGIFFIPTYNLQYHQKALPLGRKQQGENGSAHWIMEVWVTQKRRNNLLLHCARKKLSWVQFHTVLSLTRWVRTDTFVFTCVCLRPDLFSVRQQLPVVVGLLELPSCILYCPLLQRDIERVILDISNYLLLEGLLK